MLCLIFSENRLQFWSNNRDWQTDTPIHTDRLRVKLDRDKLPKHYSNYNWSTHTDTCSHAHKNISLLNCNIYLHMNNVLFNLFTVNIRIRERKNERKLFSFISVLFCGHFCLIGFHQSLKKLISYNICRRATYLLRYFISFNGSFSCRSIVMRLSFLCC